MNSLLEPVGATNPGASRLGRGCSTSRPAWPAVFRLVLLASLFLALGAHCRGQTQINVTNIGLRGDAVLTTAGTVSNSDQVVLAPGNNLSAADVGKVMLLFGAGPHTSGTNYQDLVARIVSVSSPTNAQISAAAGCGASSLRCVFGTQNADPLQQCINACNGSNTTIYFPAGIYLMIPPACLDAAFTMTGETDGKPAVTINKGGIHFLGAAPDSTILMGNGAWQLKGAWAHRGFMFWCQGPVTNNFPLVFENLTFDGGVARGNLGNRGYPASVVDGGGWDETHGALVDVGPPPMHTLKQFLNCQFVHWRGEMIKSVTTADSGLNEMRGCSFVDGDASGFNLNWTPHLITGCLFSNLDMAMEYYVGTMKTASVFQNSVITNTRVAIVLCGALSNSPSPGYSVLSNSISATQYDILIGPARNLTVSGNTFWGGGAGVATDGYAYQGTDCNRDILVENNQFNATYNPILNGSAGIDHIENLTVRSNVASGGSAFAMGWGWMTNVALYGNRAAAAPDSTRITGQYFFDDPSNIFPPHVINDAVGTSNVINYYLGMHHTVWTSSANARFLLDDSQPQEIPPGAQLVITNLAAFPVPLYLSTTTPGTPASLLNGNVASCAWTNGAWQLIQQFVPLGPPTNLRVTSPTN